MWNRRDDVEGEGIVSIPRNDMIFSFLVRRGKENRRMVGLYTCLLSKFNLP